MNKKKKGISKRAYRKKLLEQNDELIDLRRVDHYQRKSEFQWARHTARVNSQTLRTEFRKAIKEYEADKIWRAQMDKYCKEALSLDTNSNEDEVNTKTEKEVK